MTFARCGAHIVTPTTWLVLAASLAISCGDDDPKGDGEAADVGSSGSSSSTGSSSSSGSPTTGGSSSSEGGQSTGNDALLEEYCACMLFSCHDHYHELWGDDEMVAREACLNDASMVPSVGSPQSSGDSLECRLAFCTMSGGEDDAAVCPAALGESPCAE